MYVMQRNTLVQGIKSISKQNSLGSRRMEKAMHGIEQQLHNQLLDLRKVADCLLPPKYQSSK